MPSRWRMGTQRPSAVKRLRPVQAYLGFSKHSCPSPLCVTEQVRRMLIFCTKITLLLKKWHVGAGICPVGCANKKSFRAHTKRKHPETATPPALVEGAMVIPYKPGVAIFMGISRGLGYPVAICDEKSTDVNLAPGELSFAAGQF
ncbi:hypothetical protein niasHT_038169 [Heterodera trifolii]|uniref:C2H2-type domain-containing protein n=1 Tax=Heterodera trifolii TaxID=157864 RepID=A0ABD2IB67_9BILA